MKRNILALLSGFTLFTAQSPVAAAQAAKSGAAVSDRQADDKPAPPFKMFDNIWFVGFQSATAYLFKTSAGLILIDTLYKPDYEDYLPKTIQQLGLDPKDIKYIIINHAHTDHTGGANYIRKLTGARVAMAEGDWEFQRTGTYMNSFGIPRTFDPIAKDMVINDGDTLTLGDTTLKFYVLPGHTPGGTSFEFTAMEGSNRYKGFYFGGMGTDLKGAAAAQDHLDKVKRIAALPGIQVSLTDHVTGGKILEKGMQLAARKPGEPNPFVDPAIFRSETQRLVAAAEKKLKDEQSR